MTGQKKKEMIPGDIIYIEARTGNGKHKSEWDEHDINGHYEFVKEDETYIWLKEEKIIFKVQKDRIKKIDVKK